MVEGGGLENRCTRKGTVGSNPTSSARTFLDSGTLHNRPEVWRELTPALQVQRVGVIDESQKTGQPGSNHHDGSLIWSSSWLSVLMMDSKSGTSSKIITPMSR